MYLLDPFAISSFTFRMSHRTHPRYFVRFRMRAVTHAGRAARLYCAPNISGHNVYINERCWSAEFSDINV
jgi:hypothetical protein